MISSTRALASALRGAERGWDWEIAHGPLGAVVRTREVSIERAESEAGAELVRLVELRALLREDPGPESIIDDGQHHPSPPPHPPRLRRPS